MSNKNIPRCELQSYRRDQFELATQLTRVDMSSDIVANHAEINGHVHACVWYGHESTDVGSNYFNRLVGQGV